MTPATPFCPACGHNLAADAPVHVDGWTLTPTSAERDGVRVHVTTAEAIMLHSIASAGGEPVRSSALSERAGVDSDSNVVQVLICRLRKKGAPIETQHGAGYRWAREQAVAA